MRHTCAGKEGNSVCERIENSDRTGTGPDWDHSGRNWTGTTIGLQA